MGKKGEAKGGSVSGGRGQIKTSPGLPSKKPGKKSGSGRESRPPKK